MSVCAKSSSTLQTSPKHCAMSCMRTHHETTMQTTQTQKEEVSLRGLSVASCAYYCI